MTGPVAVSYTHLDVYKRQEQRKEFIQEYLTRGKSDFKELCQKYGISEKTGHKCKNRFFEYGYTLSLIHIFGAVILAGAVAVSAAPTAYCNDTGTEPIERPGWTLVFQEEFNDAVRCV